MFGALVFACSSADPVPDFESSPATKGSKQNKAPPPAPDLDGADASLPDHASECKTTPPNNKCGLDPQCGCGTNETCDVTNDATGATSCVTAGGATLGRPCSQSGDCLAGLTCAFGVCRPYCSSARTKCTSPGTDLCVEIVGDDGKPMPNKKVCTIECDPRQPSAVCGTNACIWFPTYYSPEKVSDCNFPGTVDGLAGCAIDPAKPMDAGDDFACKAGFACAKHPKYGFECERWCRIGMDSDCASAGTGFKCKDVYGTNAPVIAGVKEGVCQD
jgi:hypothetical protein